MDTSVGDISEYASRRLASLCQRPEQYINPFGLESQIVRMERLREDVIGEYSPGYLAFLHEMGTGGRTLTTLLEGGLCEVPAQHRETFECWIRKLVSASISVYVSRSTTGYVSFSVKSLTPVQLIDAHLTSHEMAREHFNLYGGTLAVEAALEEIESFVSNVAPDIAENEGWHYREFLDSRGYQSTHFALARFRRGAPIDVIASEFEGFWKEYLTETRVGSKKQNAGNESRDLGNS